jgi:RNA polymerase sigma-70 factor, ECF subfamily
MSPPKAIRAPRCAIGTAIESAPSREGALAGAAASPPRPPRGGVQAASLGEATMVLLRRIRAVVTGDRAGAGGAVRRRPARGSAARAAPRDGDEAAVLDLLARGDRGAALRLLMIRYDEAIYRFCMRIVKDEAHAEDVCQTVFLQAYENLATFAGESSLRTWLFAIAKYRSLDKMRALGREAAHFEFDEELHDEAAGSRADAHEMVEASLDVNTLSDCLERCLSAEERHYISLHYQQDLSYEEMSDLFGKKADTLRACVARALVKLRRHLEKRGVQY